MSGGAVSTPKPITITVEHRHSLLHHHRWRKSLSGRSRGPQPGVRDQQRHRQRLRGQRSAQPYQPGLRLRPRPSPSPRPRPAPALRAYCGCQRRLRSFAGTDAEGTINGQAATGTGQLLQGATGHSGPRHVGPRERHSRSAERRWRDHVIHGQLPTRDRPGPGQRGLCRRQPRKRDGCKRHFRCAEQDRQPANRVHGLEPHPPGAARRTSPTSTPPWKPPSPR
jgi:hypothetical protein